MRALAVVCESWREGGGSCNVRAVLRQHELAGVGSLLRVAHLLENRPREEGVHLVEVTAQHHKPDRPARDSDVHACL